MPDQLSLNVSISIPVLLVGGTEVQTLSVVRVLTKAGYRVTICCYYEFDTHVVTRFEQQGARVVLLNLQRSDGLLFLLFRLRRFFRDERPDIVHVQYMAPGFIPVLAARLARIPILIATVHQPGRTYGWKAKLLLRSAAGLCAAFFCNSLAVEKSWFGNATLFDPHHKEHHRHSTIYNAVDVDRIAAIVSKTDRSGLRSATDLGERPVIGVVGRLRREKGQSVLLEAMAIVRREIPSVLLLVVGDGPDRNDLQRQASLLGMGDNVRWLGQHEADKVFQLYGIMDVVAVPSIFEGFGLVAAEAMAAGLPVVGSAVDGLAEIIADHETGRLVPPEDPDALAAALIQLLGAPQTAAMMGRKGAQRVRQHFSLQRFSERTLAAYAAIQGRG
jgi:glycosyltransferase involved in cell wall biosynthesis